ncbi:hypothetical protein [Gorillibacterium massiliense]|uniref:hypothetical protein n=1 Tax=Gorillibacterium massiliense TaxID=1280390 RepID=UPI0004AE77FE|nr:hypothetical protein [Gorillibacterium massiliense]
MVVGFLIIVGIYGACAALIHLFHARQAGKENAPQYRLVLITHNNQAQIEWYVYAYLFVSWLRGRQTVIDIFDDGSDDETWTILERIAERNSDVRLHMGTLELNDFLEKHQEDHLLVLHLEKLDISPKMPLYQWL